MPVALAVLAGIGAQWLSISIMRGAISVSAVLTRFPSVRTSDLTEALCARDRGACALCPGVAVAVA